MRNPSVQRCAPLAAVIVASLACFAVSAASEDLQHDAAQAPNVWKWGGVYKTDLLRTNAPRLTIGVGNLNLRVDGDAAALLGWDDTALHTELLWNHGGKPNRRVAAVQGISNLEVAQSAARMYASWIEREFKTSGTRVLFGLPSSTLTARKSLIYLGQGSKAQTTERAGRVLQALVWAVGVR